MASGAAGSQKNFGNHRPVIPLSKADHPFPGYNPQHLDANQFNNPLAAFQLQAKWNIRIPPR
jgi:hypothetical protein